MSEDFVAMLVVYGLVLYACLVVVGSELARERWGRVPVIDPAWDKMKGGVEWCMRAPGRVVRWLHPGDTPPGLGDA